MNAIVHGRYRLEPAFPPSDTQRRRVIEMWIQESVFPDVGAATARSRELVVLMDRDDGEVAGVATVSEVLAPMAGERVWMYRSFVRREDRRGLLALRLLLDAFRILKEKTPQDGPCGVFFATENQRLRFRAVERRFTASGWEPLGVNPLGQMTWLRRF